MACGKMSLVISITSVIMGILGTTFWTLPEFLIERNQLCTVNSCGGLIKPCYQPKVVSEPDPNINQTCFMICVNYSLNYDENLYNKSYCEDRMESYCKDIKFVRCYFNVFRIEETLTTLDYNRNMREMSIWFPITCFGMFIIFYMIYLVNKKETCGSQDNV